SIERLNFGKWRRPRRRSSRSKVVRSSPGRWATNTTGCPVGGRFFHHSNIRGSWTSARTTSGSRGCKISEYSAAPLAAFSSHCKRATSRRSCSSNLLFWVTHTIFINNSYFVKGLRQGQPPRGRALDAMHYHLRTGADRLNPRTVEDLTDEMGAITRRC